MLKPVLASAVVITFQQTGRIIIASAMPTVSFTHVWLLDMNISTLKAVVNIIMLLVNDVRSTIQPKISNSWRLTTREVANMADRIRLQALQTQVHCSDDSGDTYPIMENTKATVSERIGVGVR
jgi:hypothetical protein